MIGSTCEKIVQKKSYLKTENHWLKTNPNWGGDQKFPSKSGSMMIFCSLSSLFDMYFTDMYVSLLQETTNLTIYMLQAASYPLEITAAEGHRVAAWRYGMINDLISHVSWYMPWIFMNLNEFSFKPSTCHPFLFLCNSSRNVGRATWCKLDRLHKSRLLSRLRGCSFGSFRR